MYDDMVPAEKIKVEFQKSIFLNWIDHARLTYVPLKKDQVHFSTTPIVKIEM